MRGATKLRSLRTLLAIRAVRPHIRPTVRCPSCITGRALELMLTGMVCQIWQCSAKAVVIRYDPSTEVRTRHLHTAIPPLLPNTGQFPPALLSETDMCLPNEGFDSLTPMATGKPI